MKKPTFRKSIQAALIPSLILGLSFLAVTSAQALTDISNSPITNARAVAVKPNIMVLMDTSGSMGYTHMPDELEGNGTVALMPVGYRSSQCNTLYYNPATAYLIPKAADGTSLPTPDFEAAHYNYYSTDTTKVNLSTSFRAFDSNTRRRTTTGLASAGGSADEIGPAYYYVYTPITGNEPLRYDSYACTRPDGGATPFTRINTSSAEGTGRWDRIIVSATSGTREDTSTSPPTVIKDERQNFAIWYTYYRTRMALTKSGIGLAFQDLSDQYRVGLITVNPGNPVQSDKFLKVDTFSGSHRSAWFSKLNAQQPSGSSPAREGLARVGRYYAGKTDGINRNMGPDPLVSDGDNGSCRQNFTFMTTDGYWNTEAETVGPVGLDGTTKVGQQDGTLYVAGQADTGDPKASYTPRPIYDGGISGSRSTTDASNQYRYNSCSTGLVQTKDTQIFASTLQNRYVDTFSTQTVVQFTSDTIQRLETTTQHFKKEKWEEERRQQLQRQTIQTVRTRQQWRSDYRQVLRKVTVSQLTTSQTTKKTTVIRLNTSRTDQVVTQTQERKRQTYAYNGSTEQTTAVQTCTPGRNAQNQSISCFEVDTDWYGSNSCPLPGVAASEANNWTTIDCQTETLDPLRPVQTCNAVTPNESNEWTTTECIPVNTTNVLSATCPTPAQRTPSLTNQWTTTTCNITTVGPDPVEASTCTTPNDPPTSTNSFTRTECVTTNTTTNVASCTGSNATTAASAPSWTAQNCTATVNEQGALSCSEVTPTGPPWERVECSVDEGNNVAVENCTANAGTSAPFRRVDCRAGENTETNAPVAECTAENKTVANNYTRTTCPAPIASAWTNASSCTADNTSNPRVECRINTSVTVQRVQFGTCVPRTAAENGGVQITCARFNAIDGPDAPVAVLNCTATGINGSNPIATPTAPNWVQRECAATVRSDIPVASCTANSGTSSPFLKRVCPTPVTTPEVGVNAASCASVTVAPTNENSFVETRCYNRGGTTPVESCASVTAQTGDSGNNWLTRSCTATVTPATGIDTCVRQTASAANGWRQRECDTVTSGPSPAASCVEGTTAEFVKTTCSTTVAISPDFVPTASCSATVGAPTGPNFINRECASVPGKRRQYRTTTQVSVQSTSGGNLVGSPTISSPVVGSWTNDANFPACYPTGTEPTLPATGRPGPGQLPAPPAPATAWPVVVNSPVTAGGSTNSLADVAQYYYINDLRPGDDYPDVVAEAGTDPEDDRAKWQHMTTFVMGLGVSGELTFDKDYKSGAGDFTGLRDGTKSWPTWPDPSIAVGSDGNYVDQNNYNNKRSIDDFWHTAVNGRGTYFSANDPDSVVQGVRDALTSIGSKTGAGTGASSSTLTPTQGDNFAYLARYTAPEWAGDLEVREINLLTGAIPLVDANDDPIPPIWSAGDLLTSRVGEACDNRKIVYFNAAASTNKLKPFTWNSRACDGAGQPTGTASTGLDTPALQANFASAKVALFANYELMDTFQRETADDDNLVNFIRGQYGLEGFTPGAANRLYRERKVDSKRFTLGDIVGSQPLFVRGPDRGYNDDGYREFKQEKASRQPMVYVGSNGGMFHAFNGTGDSTGGGEEWAYVPTEVMPNLYQLAQASYGASATNLHRFFVDGPSVNGDIFDPDAVGEAKDKWKSIVVFGLGAGGKGYVGLDVTDPLNPKGMWEFKFGTTCYNGTPQTSDCHVGLSYGKPIITKLGGEGTDAGTWVVLVTSGLNNVRSPAGVGDGEGYLYVLKATTGEILYKIGTGAGDSSNPSGLAQINTYVSSISLNNTVERVYGTDLLGNVWRFDVNGSFLDAGQSPGGTDAARDAIKVFQAVDSSGVPQPITTQPLLAEFNGRTQVLVGTGRLLGATDLSFSPTPQTQSFYGVRDNLRTTPLADIRSTFKKITMTNDPNDSSRRVVSCTENCSDTSWVVDLPAEGERVNINGFTARGTVSFVSNVPLQDDPCKPGGFNFRNNIDILSGLAPSTSVGGITSVRNDGGLAVGYAAIRLTPSVGNPGDPPTGGGGNDILGSTTLNTGDVTANDVPSSNSAPAGRRISWREISR